MNKASTTTLRRLKQKPAPLKVEKSVADRVKKAALRAQSLVTDTPTHINAAIKTDHDGLRNFLKTLKDTDQPMSKRKAAYKQFADLLKSHSEAEEKAVYLKVRAIGDRELKIKTSEGFSEHWLCSELMEKISATRDPIAWSAHVNVLAEVLEHHLKEEEKDLLPMIHDEMDSKLNEKMLGEYLKLREKTQKRAGKKNAGVLESQRH